MYTIDNFYDLSSELTSSAFRVRMIEHSKKEDDSDIRLKLRLGEYDLVSFPIVFKEYMGEKKLYDLLETGSANFYLISTKMRDVLKDSGLTGWDNYEVTVLDKKNNVVPGYHGLSVTGRCGPVDYTKSEIIKKRRFPESPIGRYFKGFYIGLDTWDGKDFFLPEDNWGIIISAKAAKVLTDNKFTNVVLENLAEMEIWDWQWEGE